MSFTSERIHIAGRRYGCHGDHAFGTIEEGEPYVYLVTTDRDLINDGEKIRTARYCRRCRPDVDEGFPDRSVSR